MLSKFLNVKFWSKLLFSDLTIKGAVFDEMEADYTVVVPAGAKQCYFQPMSKGTAFEIEYQVLEGGDLDINFSMTSPSGQFLFNDIKSEEGLHEVRNVFIIYFTFIAPVYYKEYVMQTLHV